MQKEKNYEIPQPYNLGECEFHLAFQAEDYEAAHKKHKEMAFSNKLGIKNTSEYLAEKEQKK